MYFLPSYTLSLLVVSCLVTSGHGLWDRQARLFRPHVETYWESWDYDKYDFASDLAKVPVTPIGSDSGVNVVNLAFALPNITSDEACHAESTNCVTAGLECGAISLRRGVKAIHEAAGYVKLAIGGDTYGNPGQGLALNDVTKFVERISKVVEDYELDGVDLTQVRDCGFNTDCGLVEVQLLLIRTLRLAMPRKIISYTFPWNPNSLLHREVIGQGHPYLDTITGFRGDKNLMKDIEALGVPRNKIVWGVPIAYFDCDMMKTNDGAHFVRQGGYGGVLTWSINEDTANRGDNPSGACNQFQTGQPDASYVNTISHILNH